MNSMVYEAIMKESPECREAARNGLVLTSEQCFWILQTTKERAKKLTNISSIALLVIGAVSFVTGIIVIVA